MLVYLFLALFLVETSCALFVDIDVEPSFESGEIIYFDYTITPSLNQNIVYALRVNCPNAPSGLLEEIEISLEADKKFEDTHYSFEVDSSVEPQECTASFILLEPYEQIFSEKFSINTDPSFDFEIKLDKKVFIQNEDIYLDYESEISNPVILTNLTFPDKTTKQIPFPTSIKAEQEGTYELEITASKENYKTITKKEQFAVIEKEPEIQLVSEEFEEDPLIDNGPLVDEDPILGAQVEYGSSLEKEKKSFFDIDFLKSFFSFKKENLRLHILVGAIFTLLIVIVLYWAAKKD